MNQIDVSPSASKDSHFLLQILRSLRFKFLDKLFWSSGTNNFAAVVAAVGTNINDIVSHFYNVKIVFNCLHRPIVVEHLATFLCHRNASRLMVRLKYKLFFRYSFWRVQSLILLAELHHRRWL